MNLLFQKYATKRNLIALIILTVLCNMSLALYFGNFTAPILDTFMYYSADQAYEAIGEYGEDLEQRYIQGTLMLDFIYPVIYCLMLAFALFRLGGSAKVATFPLGILPFDYLENISIIYLINKLPARYDLIAGMAGIFTLIKWSLVIICLLGIILLVILRFYNRRNGSKIYQ